GISYGPLAVCYFLLLFGRCVAVINPADKSRFGEDSTSLVYENALRIAKEVGVVLEVGDDFLKIGSFWARFCEDRIETPYGAFPMSAWQWQALKVLLLNFFTNYRKEPDLEELRTLLFAVGLE
ncbi:MAG: hypothetical protein ABWK05_08600, partial [Pyrobaculum sp.]